jgi:hypothetical protein
MSADLEFSICSAFQNFTPGRSVHVYPLLGKIFEIDRENSGYGYGG